MDPAPLKVALCHASGHRTRFIEFLSSAEEFFVLLKKGSVSTLTELEFCYRSSKNITALSNRYRDQAAVFMMLLSGRSQISEAISAVGIGENETEFLAVYSNRSDLERFGEINGMESVESYDSIPSDDSSLDSQIFPRITDIIYDLSRSH